MLNNAIFSIYVFSKNVDQISVKTITVTVTVSVIIPFCQQLSSKKRWKRKEDDKVIQKVKININEFMHQANNYHRYN